ncbi:MAG: M48 family metalloprotease [bacterium JZ-2024 1]
MKDPLSRLSLVWLAVGYFLQGGLARNALAASQTPLESAPPYLLIGPGCVELVLPGLQTEQDLEKFQRIFPGARGLAQKSVIEKFQTEDGIPLPYGDIPGEKYARYTFRRGWADLGLMKQGVRIHTDSENRVIVVIHHRAYQVFVVPEVASEVRELEFEGRPPEYRYATVTILKSARIVARPDAGVTQRVATRFMALFCVVVAFSFLWGIMVNKKLLTEEVARAGNLMLLLAIIYALLSALESENVLAVAFYYAGRLALLATVGAFGLIYTAGRWAYYPGVRAKMPIPFGEYAVQTVRQATLVTAPVLAYLLLDSFLEEFWISLAMLAGFFATMTLISPTIIRWLFRAVPMNETTRERFHKLCQQRRVPMRAFYEYSPRYTFNPNAFVAGVVPFNRALFVSTHLLSLLTPEEQESVMAHELAHARRHHPFWLFAVSLAYLSLAGWLLSWLPEGWSNLWTAGAVLVGALFFFSLSRWFERQADMVAATEFGEVYLRAVRKLYSATTETESTRFEYLRTHPSQHRRLAAIQQWISSAPLKSS